MPTIVICDDLVVRTDDEKLTDAEAREREAHREALVKLISDIVPPQDEPSARSELRSAV